MGAGLFTPVYSLCVVTLVAAASMRRHFHRHRRRRRQHRCGSTKRG